MTTVHAVFLIVGILAIIAGSLAAVNRSWFNAFAAIAAGVLLVLVSFNVIA